MLSFYHLPLSFKLPLIVQHLLPSCLHMAVSLNLHFYRGAAYKYPAESFLSMIRLTDLLWKRKSSIAVTVKANSGERGYLCRGMVMTGVRQGHWQGAKMKCLQTGGCISFLYSKIKSSQMWNSETWEECHFFRHMRKIPAIDVLGMSPHRHLLPKILTKDLQQSSGLQVWQNKGISSCKLYIVKSYPAFDFEP